MNSLHIDLTGKTIVIKRDVFPRNPIPERVLKVAGGFGCKPELIGSAVMGELLHNGEKIRIDGGDVMRLATEEDIEKAHAIRAAAAS